MIPKHISSFEKQFFDESHKDEIYIDPTARVSPNAKLARGVKIGPYSVIMGDVSIGEYTQVYSHVIIGSPAQDINTRETKGTVSIGARNILKEFVTIGSPKIDTGETRIGDDCFIMNFSHVAHDATLEDRVILTNNSQIGGHAYIEHDVLMMANSGVHQFGRIGAYTALSPFGGARQDLPPFSLFTETPALFAGLNRIKLKRAGISAESIENIKTITHLFYTKKIPFIEIEEQANQNDSLKNDRYVQKFLSFIRESSRGVSRRSVTDR